MDLISYLHAPFEDFLRQVVRLYPTESCMMVEDSDVSPESICAPRHRDSWAVKLFGDDVAHQEFDRAALGLLYFQGAVAGNRCLFPVSDDIFCKIQRLVAGVAEDEALLRAWSWAVLFNDLGKLHRVAARCGGGVVDHDALLRSVLEKDPTFFPGWETLPDLYRKRFLQGLASGFNPGKAAQLECHRGAWEGFRSLSIESARVHFGHCFFDFLGVTGAFNPLEASPNILREPTIAQWFSVWEHPDPLWHEKERLRRLGIGASSTEEPAMARLAGMMRIETALAGRVLLDAWQGLPSSAKCILAKELGVSGGERSHPFALEPQYAPALFQNAFRHEGGMEKAMLALARVFWQGRHLLQGQSFDRGIVVLNLVEMATAIAQRGLLVLDEGIIFSPGEDGFRIRLESIPPSVKFPVRSMGGFLDGHRAAFVGCGGGSDVLQATQLALESSADVACVISVRTMIQASGEERTVEHHGGEILPGVWRITPNTRGNGRFLEHLSASLVRTYLVLDRQDGTLTDLLQAALTDAGGASLVVGVDTGGDALHRIEIHDISIATPDADQRTLMALRGLEQEIKTVTLALGVDSPRDAQERLRLHGAVRLVADDRTSRSILDRLEQWQGRCAWLGKTPLAWASAHRGERGLVALPLPCDRVLDDSNPWNPFVLVDGAMKDGFFLALEDHLKLCGLSP